MTPKIVWHIGDVVRKVRELRGFKTVKAFAKSIPMRQNTLGDFERFGDEGRRVDPHVLARLLQALELDKHQLFALVPIPRGSEDVVSSPAPALPDADRDLLARFKELGAHDQALVLTMIEGLSQRNREPIHTEHTDAALPDHHTGTRHP